MKINLSENIRTLRKENSLTQEQLAEALGVTVGAVSKWESGSSQPELSLIVEMADLFEVSVDVLLGYELQGQGKENALARLKELRHNKTEESALTEAEKILKKYPNCFEIVYWSAHLYLARGVETGNKKWLKRAMELLRYSCRLLDQNSDENISELSIQNDIAEIYLSLEEYDKAVELFKRNNSCGVNNVMIGCTLAAGCNRPDEAEPYLSRALLTHLTSQFQLVMGYMNLYYKKGNYQSALDISLWHLKGISDLKRPGKVSFLDKTEAAMHAICAIMYFHMGQKEQSKESLYKAKFAAGYFDAAPDYNGSSVRFVDHMEPRTAYDDLGATAMEGIEKIISEENLPELTAAWEEVRDE